METADAAIYEVVERDRGLITLLGGEFGPCKSVDDAAKVAITAAEDAVEKGWPAEVRVHSEGEVFTIWKNGTLKGVT